MLSGKENVPSLNQESPMTTKIKQFNLMSLTSFEQDTDDLDFDSVQTVHYAPEPLLIPNTKRFVLFPIQYNAVSSLTLFKVNERVH